jgi:hypothetical protein
VHPDPVQRASKLVAAIVLSQGESSPARLPTELTAKKDKKEITFDARKPPLPKKDESDVEEIVSARGDAKMTPRSRLGHSVSSKEVFKTARDEFK